MTASGSWWGHDTLADVLVSPSSVPLRWDDEKGACYNMLDGLVGEM